jgi:two-component system sensor kinase FixL
MRNGVDAVRRDDSLFQALMAGCIDAIVAVGERGDIKACNHPFEKLFGYAAGQVVGMNVGILLPGSHEADDRVSPSVALAPADSLKVGVDREVVGRCRDRSALRLRLSVGRARLGNESVLVGVMHPVAGGADADSPNAQQLAPLRAILDAVPEAIVVIDAAGLIESFSQSASRLFGYAPNSLVGKHVSVLMTTSYRVGTVNQHSSAGRSGRKWTSGKRRIVVGRRVDGSTFPMEIVFVEFGCNDRKCAAGFMRDITDSQNHLHELQAELLHASRLSAMGQLTAAIAHEVNQPLTAAVNFVMAAKRTLASVASEPDARARATEFMEKAARQALRTGEIIRNLRSFVDKREGRRVAENLNKVVEEAIALGFVGAAEANVTLRLNLSDMVPSVLVDRIQVQQVLINLIRNSIEAMATLNKRELSLSTGLAGADFAQVTVADTGPGIPSRISKRLFQPFVTTKRSGMGMGLSICQSIIAEHGGRIWAEPVPGGGVAFHVRLPLAHRVEAAA